MTEIFADAYAHACDAVDPLRHFREEFHLPLHDGAAVRLGGVVLPLSGARSAALAGRQYDVIINATAASLAVYTTLVPNGAKDNAAS